MSSAATRSKHSISHPTPLLGSPTQVEGVLHEICFQRLLYRNTGSWGSVWALATHSHRCKEQSYSKLLIFVIRHAKGQQSGYRCSDIRANSYPVAREAITPEFPRGTTANGQVFLTCTEDTPTDSTEAAMLWYILTSTLNMSNTPNHEPVLRRQVVALLRQGGFPSTASLGFSLGFRV